jgi:hypothetical protein
MRKLLLLIIPLFLFVTTGCKDTCSCKKVTCPAFNDPMFDKWFAFPYYQAIFSTNTNKTDTFVIAASSKSGSYQANQGCYNASSGCSASTTINLIPVTNNGFSKGSVSYNSQTPFTSSNTEKTIVFKLYNFMVTAKDIDAQGLVINPGSPLVTQHIDNIVLNGKNFSNVQMLRQDTSDKKYLGPYKVYIAQNMGLVAYETYPAIELWVKQ